MKMMGNKYHSPHSVQKCIKKFIRKVVLGFISVTAWFHWALSVSHSSCKWFCSLLCMASDPTWRFYQMQSLLPVWCCWLAEILLILGHSSARLLKGTACFMELKNWSLRSEQLWWALMDGSQSQIYVCKCMTELSVHFGSCSWCYSTAIDINELDRILETPLSLTTSGLILPVRYIL